MGRKKMTQALTIKAEFRFSPGEICDPGFKKITATAAPPFVASHQPKEHSR
jgi:hypothetical protein